MKVLVFGSFDPLHEGHRALFRQARAAGEPGAFLVVVVASDSYIRVVKGHTPLQGQGRRLAAVAAEPLVDEARLGDSWPVSDPYRLLSELKFDVLAVGYDQRPDDAVIAAELDRRGKGHVRVVRLRAYRPERYASSRLRRERQAQDER